MTPSERGNRGLKMKERTATGGLLALVRDHGEEKTDIVYRIGDLAREFNVTLRTLRFYEDRKLIEPKRSGSTRLYNRDDRERLKLILLAKRSGFSLIEIEEILALNDQGALSPGAIENLVGRFERQLAALLEHRRELDAAAEEVGDAITYLKGRIAG